MTVDVATAERLDRLEREVAALRARAAQSEPARMSPRSAATMLGCSLRTVFAFAARGLLARLPKSAGAGKTARTYFDPANVRALAESEDAARAWVARRKYVPHAKRR